MAATAQHPTGYLPPEAAAGFDLSPPPAPGSPEALAERRAWEAAAAGADVRDWRQAALDDAAFTAPSPALLFACALGRQTDAARAPITTALLRRTLVDVEAAAAPLKRRFARPRPYEGDDAARLCITVPPERRRGTATAYPSSSAALGVVWAEALSLLAPERADALRRRGERLGDLRLVCRVHYASDVTAGRTLGHMVTDQLRANAAFQADAARARAELAALPPAACAD